MTFIPFIFHIGPDTDKSSLTLFGWIIESDFKKRKKESWELDPEWGKPKS